MNQTIKCKCCGKEVVKYASRKYCSACGEYRNNMMNEMAHLRLQNHKLKMELYGMVDRRQRIRLRSKSQTKQEDV
jgi:ribosomal protein L37E